LNGHKNANKKPRRSKILLMASKAQLNDESFNIFLTQKTNLGEKAINLMSLSGVWFFFFLCLSRAFVFFVFFVRGARHGLA
jgi:hypothetical protein